MADWLLIESRDPFEWTEVAQHYELAQGLAKDGKVTLFLVQNGVLAARRGAKLPQGGASAQAEGRAASGTSPALEALAKAGVEVLADDFSLRERGIGADRLVSGVRAAPLDRALDAFEQGRKTIFY